MIHVLRMLLLRETHDLNLKKKPKTKSNTKAESNMNKTTTNPLKRVVDIWGMSSYTFVYNEHHILQYTTYFFVCAAGRLLIAYFSLEMKSWL